MLKRIINYIKDKKEIVHSFKRLSKYMADGKYVFDDSLLYIYLCDEIVSKKADELFFNNYQKVMLRKSLFWRMINYFVKMLFIKKHFIIKNDGEKTSTNVEGFIGNIFLPGTNGKDIKIFDVFSNKILMVYTDSRAYMKKLDTIDNFINHFPSPAVSCINTGQLSLIQEFVNSKQRKEWSQVDHKNVVEKVLNDEISYLAFCKENKKYEYKSFNDLSQRNNKNSCLASFIKANMNEAIFNSAYPYVMLHGDLWTSNILISRDNPDKIYYIDWETSDKFIFIYDFMFLILNEALINNDYDYMRLYLNGYLDSHIQKVFQIFDLNFEEQFRIDYLFAALFNQYLNRWVTADSKLEKKILKGWKHVMSTIEDLIK